MIYKRYLKRLMDILISLTGILFVLPLLLLLILLLAIANRGNVFFIQERPGKDEKIFRVVKFKTMNDWRDASGKLLPDQVRLTKVGRFIRSTSLDELPQLINVLKGDMSLIGPRPLLVVYLERYNNFQARRHEVRPGITGWAQVNGRNAISWQERFELDVWYVDNLSFWLDLKIIVMTIVNILRRKDINATDAATMKPFYNND